MDYGSPFDAETDDVRLARIFARADLPVARVLHVLPAAGALVVGGLRRRNASRRRSRTASDRLPARDDLYRSAVRLAADHRNAGHRRPLALRPGIRSGSRRRALPVRDAFFSSTTSVVFSATARWQSRSKSRSKLSPSGLRRIHGSSATAITTVGTSWCAGTARWLWWTSRMHGGGPTLMTSPPSFRDAYVDIGEDEVDDLFDLYCRQLPGSHELAAVRTRFDIVAAKEMIKALGTFGYQIAVLGRERYRSSLRRTVEQLVRVLPARVETAPLAEAFLRHGVLSS